MLEMEYGNEMENVNSPIIGIQRPINRFKSFSHRWIEFCENNNITFKLLDFADNDIISRIKEIDILLWHFDPYDALYAQSIIKSAELLGKITYPNSETSWHFDNKIAQKYVFESLDLPFPKTHIFYDIKEAKIWANKTNYPIVFKKSNGASSKNVILLKDKESALSLINVAYKKGLNAVNPTEIFRDKLRVFAKKKDYESILAAIKSFVRIVIPGKNYRILPKQKGYVYFQEFMPDNSHDTRIIVIGNRAFGVIRHNRENDFRASGSGMVTYDHNKIDMDCIQLAFKISQIMKMQSVACDFVFGENRQPILLEVSYGFITGKFYESCEGIWDSELNWLNIPVRPEQFILEDCLLNYKNKINSRLDV